MMTEKQAGGSTVRLVLGFLVSVGSLTGLFLLTDAERIRTALTGIRLTVLLPGIILIIASLLTRAFAWRVILREKITLWQSFFIVNAGYFINTILPFRLGEISRAFLLMPSGFGFWEALPTIALERMFDGLFALGLLFFSLPRVLNFPLEISFTYLLGAAVLLGLLAAYFLVRYRDQIIRWLTDSSLLGSRVKDRLINFLESILSSMLVLTDPIRLLQVLLGMALSWGIALAFQYSLLRAFIPGAKLSWAAFALGAVAVGVSVPSSPGNIGLYEASITLALSAVGVDQSLAFTYALTSHIINLVLTTLFGGFGLVREGVGLKEVWQFGKKQIEEDAI